MNTQKFERSLMTILALAVVFFAVLVSFSYYQIHSILFNSIAELITIPLILILVFSLIFSIMRMVKRQGSNRIVTILLLSSSTVAVLVALTVMQMA